MILSDTRVAYACLEHDGRSVAVGDSVVDIAESTASHARVVALILKLLQHHDREVIGPEVLSADRQSLYTRVLSFCCSRIRVPSAHVRESVCDDASIIMPTQVSHCKSFDWGCRNEPME